MLHIAPQRALRCFVVHALHALVLLSGLLAVAGAAHAQCDPRYACCTTPPPGGTPVCGQSGPAEQPTTAPTAPGGNPIDIVSGNKHQREVDLPALPGVLGLELVRHYNSALSHRSSHRLGRGWRLSYEAELRVGANALAIVQADGATLSFVRGVIEPERFSHPDALRGSVVRHYTALREPYYLWRWPDGRELRFGAEGRLEQIVAASGEFVSLLHAPDGRLIRATDPQGRELSLLHDKLGRIEAIETPVGRFVYAYEGKAANLVKVTLPGTPATVRRYHYEDTRHPHLLTGISVEAAAADGKSAPASQRLVTWGYDERGWAVSSVKGDGKDNVERVSVQRKALPRGGGEATLTNSLGHTTVYRWRVIDHQPRLIESIGPGCASCGETNVRYGYDPQGRLVETTKLKDRGQPLHGTRHVLDPLGRLRSTSHVPYRDGKPQAERLQVRYAYPSQASTAPSLIARPSVVAGKEHTLRILYNEAGQPTQVTEEGFSPVDENGQPAPAGTPISRTTTYTYRRINGRSVLTQVDGPLPNGPQGTPQDSDITLAGYDPRGNHIVRLDEPGGFVSSFGYHAQTGRLVRVQNDEGFATTFHHDPSGQVTRVQSTAPDGFRLRDQAFKYDTLGHLREAGSGSAAEGNYKAHQRFGMDAFGRTAWAANALGVLQQSVYDTESRVVQAGRYSSAMAQENRYAYDALGRFVKNSDSTGARVAIERDASGAPQRLTDALGRVHTPGRDVSTTPRPRHVRDDFGRIVATLSPDSGLSVQRFDAADRLVAGTDALGNRAVYEHDAAGRIARQLITDKRSGGVTTTTWRYQGRRLVALEHPTQSEHYAHDVRGFLVSKRVTVRQDDGKALSSITRYSFDKAGVLEAVSLLDGSRVVYRRNGQGQIVALERSRIQTPWLRWLLPAQTIVEGIERDIVGPTRYLSGNGIEAHWLRSREGVLARMAYRNTRAPDKPLAALRMRDILSIASAHAAAPPAAASASSAQAPGASASASMPGALGLPPDPQAFIDHRYLWDAQGNLLFNRGRASESAYAYDARDRLIVAAASASTHRYHYDAADRRLLSQEGADRQGDLQAHTRKTMYQEGSHRWLGDREPAHYDEAGQPSRIGQREYVWDATGRLVEVRQEDRTLARYRYSHRGERIGKTVGDQSTGYLYDSRQLAAELDGRGRITRQYVYLADQPIAAIDSPQGHELAAEEAGTLQRIGRDVHVAVTAWLGSDERIAWLHANHLGAVEAATDEEGRIVWQASYAPFGAVRVDKGDLALNLRLPGQYEDAETGLHYNGQRYYDPRRGEYLTPDPLGTPDGPNGYAYVNFNPLRYVDPDGLALFAFDGTDNTDVREWLAARNSSLSNVVRFRNAYNDGARRYVTGVGTDHAGRDTYGDIIAANFSGLGGRIPDRGGNYSGPTRIERMLRYFEEEANAVLDDNEVMHVDIVGFSRGAAQARDFANRLVANTRNGWYRYQLHDARGGLRFDPAGRPMMACQRVNFRFMGLWDTVLSTNRSGTEYNQAIPPQFSYVAHAVALNEYRSAPAGVNAGITAFTTNFPYWDNTRVHLPPDRDHYGGFPLESIGRSYAVPGMVRIERGFIGAHADIGGGYGANENGLSTVALSWMVAQAQIAGVRMDAQNIRVDMNDPVIHDQSNALRVGNPLTTPNFQAPGTAFGTSTYAVEDRQINGGLGGFGQRTQTFGRPEPGGDRSMTNADTHAFIDYTARNTANDTRRTNDIPEIRNLQNRTGTVDMHNYMSWLRQHGYVFAGEW